MHELNRHGTLADRRGNAFDRAGADVSGREDTGPAGLQQERLPTASPVGEPRQSRTCLDEALGVPLDFRREPFSPWECPNETEQRRGRDRLNFPGLRC